MKVQNDSKALEKALRLDADSVKHAGNFIFTGKLNGFDVTISTEPADEEFDTLKVLKVEIVNTDKKEEADEEDEFKLFTLAMEGPNEFQKVGYVPTCRHGCDDCIHDPAYIKATYPEWYAELYGPKTPKEAAQDSRGCAMCKEGELYDDEDK